MIAGVRSHPPAQAAIQSDRYLFFLILVVFLTTLLLGGAGDDYPLLGAIVQAGQLLLLAAIACVRGNRHGPLTRCGLAILVAAIALVLLQLVPLPFSTWSQLPGHTMAIRVLTVVGIPPTWRPLTLDTGYTIAAGLEVLPALAMFLATTRVDARRQRFLMTLVVAVAGLSAALGAVQRAAGASILFASQHAANAPGLLVNRNHEATFLLVAILLSPIAVSVVLPALHRIGRFAVAGAVILAFAGGTVATTSRAGLVVLPLAVTGAMLLIAGARPRLLPSLAVVGGIVAACWAGLHIPAVRLVLARFTPLDERALYWRDSEPAITAFWPLGSGIGTFTRVFPLYEQDTLIGGASINAAHNDYVQLLLEGGLPAALLIGAGIALLLWAMARLAMAQIPDAERRMGWAAAGAMIVILLHSIVDYPLRMMSLMAVMGLLAAILLGHADRRPDPHAGGSR